jgi:putative cardiolipin synthase
MLKPCLRGWLLLLLLLSGCVSVPFDYPKSPSAALSASADTVMGGYALEWSQQHGENSGFVALAGGNDALGARLKLIESAEVSIDAQYFLLKPDEAGALFIGKLLNAADRGVRVRLLIDDIFTPGLDSQFTLFNSHPNVEVRLFNPLSRQSAKSWSMLWNFSRANRRMHNKSFTVDDSITIIGGRNIADEYFEIKPEVEFNDFELLAVGPVVPEVNAAFDLFWNSELAVPMEAFAIDHDPQELDQWREVMTEVVSGARESVYARAVDSVLLEDISEGRLEPLAAPAYVVTDSPEKLKQAVGKEEYQSLAQEIERRFAAAESEIIIITPYYVPQKSGVEAVEALLAKGLRVVIITNSLASTNHVPVHSGYSRYRKRLIKAGAELYELKVDAVNSEAAGETAESQTLHTKAIVIDRETLFIGSLNFDPRSVDINTEMGVFIDSAEGAQLFAEIVGQDLAQSTYSVQLNENNKLRWVYQGDGVREELKKEPQTSLWRRFAAGFYGVLPIEGQL